ncbi:MAG: hypothetical protein GY859_37910 [Desulfobacterales bacterium]|nr:hypothetical protein [Desulfobacterales bacterium]
MEMALLRMMVDFVLDPEEGALAGPAPAYGDKDVPWLKSARIPSRGVIRGKASTRGGTRNSMHEEYNDFFFRTSESNLIVYGWMDRDFFDYEYDTKEEYENALQELKQKRAELKG